MSAAAARRSTTGSCCAARLDASTFVVNGLRYLTWAQQEPAIPTNSNVYLARMGGNPWETTGPVARLVVPTYDWETRGYRVAEAPAVIQRDGRVFQKLYWNADGTPNFGIPVPDGATPVRLRSHDLTTSFVRHYDHRARVEPNVTNLADSQFRIVAGLGGAGTVSLESTNFPGHYLRHRGFALYVERDDGSALFDGDASFHRRAGLADGTGLSLHLE